MAKKSKTKKKLKIPRKKTGKKPSPSGKSASLRKRRVRRKHLTPKTSVAAEPVVIQKTTARKKRPKEVKIPREKRKPVAEKKPQEKKKLSIFEKRWVGVVSIIFLSLVIYSNTFKNEFVYDDTAFIQENNSIRKLDDISRFFTSVKSFSAKGDFFIYRPLSTLTFALDYRLWGLKPNWFHILNVLFHVLNGILIYLLMNALMKHRLASLLTALIFVSHPVQTESVTWISGRSNLMFLTFFLLSLLFYIGVHRTKGLKRVLYLLLSLISYAIGLLSKEMAITLPVVLMLFDFCFAEKERLRTIFRNVKYYLLFGLITWGYLYLRYTVLGRMSGQNEYIGGSLSSTLLSSSS
ncbi:hypothetical protein ES703_94997 [subsurface metagenome]